MKEFIKKSAIASFLLAMVGALLFRSLLFEPFHIPSGSMKSTLLVGDYIFVSKYAYGYSRYSFPFALKLFNGRVFYSQPQAGDVIVFRPVERDNINYIKRVIGVPGDTVQLIRGDLYINNIKMQRERIDDFTDLNQNGDEDIPRYIETLYNGRKYEVLSKNLDNSLDNTQVYTVPEGCFFVLGDNRDNSADSRLIGLVPMENVVGRALIVALSLKSWLPPSFRSDRILHKI